MYLHKLSLHQLYLSMIQLCNYGCELYTLATTLDLHVYAWIPKHAIVAISDVRVYM